MKTITKYIILASLVVLSLPEISNAQKMRGTSRNEVRTQRSVKTAAQNQSKLNTGNKTDRYDRRDHQLDRRDDRLDYKDDRLDRRDDRLDRRDDRHDRWQRHHRRYRHHHRFGHRLHILPVGYRTLMYGGLRLYYHAGLWYRLTNGVYVVGVAPAGIALADLPNDFITISVSGMTYHYYYGTFYQYDISRQAYVVVDAPKGAEIPALPNGYTTIQEGGTSIYLVGVIRYRPIIRDGIAFYVVV